jgi:5-formyltetrahydrofolate cyclo-ligase
MAQAWKAGKTVYLPVLVNDPPQSLRFAPYRPGVPLQRNRFNIPEPDSPITDELMPDQLDLVLTPLVAFDLTGTRLGMGGGFYDRSFSFLLNHGSIEKRPYLLGLGYEFQKATEVLVREGWDVPLDAAVTEAAFYRFEKPHEITGG